MSSKRSENCVFCKIATGALPSHPIRSSETFLAILDAYPAVLGQTLVLTREHEPSYIFRLEDDLLRKFIRFAKDTAELLDRALGSSRCILVAEGLEVDHAHLKLYPVGAGESKGQGRRAAPSWRSTPDPAHAPAPDHLRQLAERIARVA